MVPRLRVKRAIAIFWNSGPKTGAFSFSGSTTLRTRGVRLNFFHSTPKATKKATTKRIELFSSSERNTRNRVGAGSVPPSEANISLKVGTMKSSMPVTPSTAMTATTTG